MEIEVVTNNEQLVSCLTESKESKNTLQRLQIELQSHLSMVQDHTHTHNIGIGSENPGMDYSQVSSCCYSDTHKYLTDILNLQHAHLISGLDQTFFWVCSLLEHQIHNLSHTFVQQSYTIIEYYPYV